MTSINERIAAFRLKMKEQKLDAFLIPGADPHQSEYIAEHWQFRQWISGFTGSAGLFFLTHDYAGLSTDSRYFIQAEKELAVSEIVLHKQKVAHSPQVIPWLKENLKKGAQVGVDPSLHTIQEINAYEKRLNESGIQLKFSLEIIDSVWVVRPDLPKDTVFELAEEFASESRSEKLSIIRRLMKKSGANHHLVTTLDDIAWIFNLRGTDVACNPVAIAYTLISSEKCILFINEQKVPKALANTLESENISIQPYHHLAIILESITDHETILLDPTKTNAYLNDAIKHATVIYGDNISSGLKAIKNQKEVRNIKTAMLKDGVALTKLYMWLEKTIALRPVPETEVAIQLANFRKEQGLYHGESFPAIVGYKGNGAIVHYRAKEGDCANILPEGILLIDSGGQYSCGTTDITRTIALSKPTYTQKRDYTLVLKGHIEVANLKFPHGTRGHQIDLLARKSLWEYGLDYGHGTGHGVGFFLNVHEGPQSISPAAGGKAAVVLAPGMLTSNEPGFYKTGEYGIRIENLVYCTSDQNTDFGTFLKFETLTLFPIDTSLIDFPLLDKDEVEWLNKYHLEVYQKLAPMLNEEEKSWMKDRCKSI